MPQRPLSHSDALLSEREALAALIGSDGWRAFVRHAREEWYGQGYYARMSTALTSDDSVAAKAIHKASIEIGALLDWPARRITELKGVPE